jgi:hypothetical protein
MTEVLTELETVVMTVTVTVVCATEMGHVDEVTGQWVCDCQCAVQSSTCDTTDHSLHTRTVHTRAHLRQDVTSSDRRSCC